MTVKAELEPKTTTIDQASGEVSVERKGVFRGIGQGFKDHLAKAAKIQKIGAVVNVGEYPAGHVHEGQWAIQIIVGPAMDKESADLLADRLTPIIEGFLGGKALKIQ